MLKFLSEVSWVGKAFTGGYKISEDRAKTEFLDFKYRNRNNPKIQNYSFEDFLEYKQGQVKALAAEVRVIAILMGILAALGADWDDDGDKDYKESWMGRQTYRFFNRYRREMMSLVNPGDYLGLFNRGSVPLAGLAKDFWNTTKNTFDVAYEDITGEEDKKDRSPRFYYLHEFVPGLQIIKPFELFEEHKQAEY
jgi:hypothetical protein